MDEPWWKIHLAEVRASFAGELCSTFKGLRKQGVNCLLMQNRQFKAFGNSGAGAVSLAGLAGARRVLMLGYDCQRTGGKVHWHGNHPKGLGNAGSMPKWPQQFAKLKAAMEGVEIINCSRATALTCFPRGDLETCLAEAAG